MLLVALLGLAAAATFVSASAGNSFAPSVEQPSLVAPETPTTSPPGFGAVSWDVAYLDDAPETRSDTVAHANRKLRAY